MTMFNKGDKVSVLDDAMDGVVITVKDKVVTIETTDGFVMNYNASELIKIGESGNLMDGIKGININQINKEKEIPKPRSFVKEKKDKNELPVPEFDLHIEKLVPNKRGMSNYDILTLQAETAQRHIEFAIRNRIPKIVFIHGIGEGILKAELDFLLGRYDNIVFQDANYQKYGQGATEVYFKQNK
jgi:dsDNA-specific endonuclease/ATPase MutS2